MSRMMKWLLALTVLNVFMFGYVSGRMTYQDLRVSCESVPVEWEEGDVRS